MEITITVDLDGIAHVHTSSGIYQKCSDENQAITYADGLKDGYNAAIGKLGVTCRNIDIVRQR